MKKKTIFATLILAYLTLLLISCYTPNPLYGTWTDNDGNKIQFMDDATFTASIKDSTNKSISYEGEWSIVDNILILKITGDNEYTRNTEWDIRGAMLYLTWTAGGVTKNLTLYHTAR